MVGVGSEESCFEFSFNTIRAATDDFSEPNKLGQGGFGEVYKVYGCSCTGLFFVTKVRKSEVYVCFMCIVICEGKASNWPASCS